MKMIIYYPLENFALSIDTRTVGLVENDRFVIFHIWMIQAISRKMKACVLYCIVNIFLFLQCSYLTDKFHKFNHRGRQLWYLVKVNHWFVIVRSLRFWENVVYLENFRVTVDDHFFDVHHLGEFNVSGPFGRVCEDNSIRRYS